MGERALFSPVLGWALIDLAMQLGWAWKGASFSSLVHSLGLCLGKREAPGVLLAPGPTGSRPAALTGKAPCRVHLFASKCVLRDRNSRPGGHIYWGSQGRRQRGRASLGGQVTGRAGWGGRGSGEAEPLSPPQFPNGPQSAFPSASLPLGQDPCPRILHFNQGPPNLPPPQFPEGPAALRPPLAGPTCPRLRAGTCPHPSASPPLHFPLPSFPPAPPPRGEAAAAAAAAADEAEAVAAAAAAGGARLGLRGRAGGHGGQHVPGRR